jgi:OOP family OmpA-OmpF porin
MIRVITICLLACPLPATALTLDFPRNAILQTEIVAENDSYAMPVGPWADGEIPVLETIGAVTRQAWRIGAQGLSTQSIMQPLRQQLEVAGFEVLYACRTDICGGFDFRFGTDVIGPPEMIVDLGDFRYVAAQRRTDGDAETISLLVSRSARAGFVQVIRVGPKPESAPLATPTDPALAGDAIAAPVAQSPVNLGDLAAQLDGIGRAVLADLAFDTGSSDLGAGEFASLQALADYLAERPGRQVALVGHTDSSGPLDNNIALSKRRAGSVMDRLVRDYGVARRQVDAQGMGYLAPVANNLTEAGREANRRVEVIVTSIE